MPRFDGIPVPEAKPRFEGVPVQSALTESGEVPQQGGFKEGVIAKGFEYGPEIGGTIGGLFGPKGAALGGAAGEGANVLYQTLAEGKVISPEESAKRMAWEGAKQGTLDYVGGKIVRGAGRILKPAGDTLTEGGKRIMKLAEEYGLPVSASRLAPSKMNRLFQWGADYTIAGKAVSDHYRGKILESATDAADNFADISGLTKLGKEELSEGLGKNLANMKNFDDAYKDFNRIMGTIASESKGTKGVSEIFINDAHTEINSAVSRIMDANPGMTWHQAKRELIEGSYNFPMRSREGVILSRLADDDVVPQKDVSSLLKSVWRNYGKQAEITINSRKALKDLIINDIDKQAADIGIKESVVAAKEAGDAVFADVMEYMKRSPNVRQLVEPSTMVPGQMRFEVQPELMIDRLVKKGSPQELLELKGRLLNSPEIEGIMGGKEAWAGLEYNYIQDMINSSMRQVGEAKVTRFSPGEFARIFKEREAVVKEVFPNSYGKLKDFADLMKNAAEDFDKLGEKNFANSLIRGGVDVGGVGVPSGFGALISWGMLTPSSKNVLKKYFTGTLFPKAVEKAAYETGKAGIRVAGKPIEMPKTPAGRVEPFPWEQ